jgi:hypothetical protein
MGTPLYPKDQATEWQNMKKDVRMLFTSASYRRALQQIGATALKVWKSIEIQAGAFLSFKYGNGTEGIYIGRHSTGSDDADGLIIRRSDGSPAMWIYSRTSDGYGFSALYDKSGNIIFSDDGNTGTGMARPWLSYGGLVHTTELVAPPAARQTSNTTDTSVVTFVMPDQHPRIRVQGYVYNPGGGTNNVKLIEPSSGTTLYSNTYAGTNYGWFDFTVTNPNFDFGTVRIYDITIRRSAGAGAVGITIVSVMGVQS